MAFGFKIAQPNEALIVSGKRGKGDGAEEAQQYNIVPSGKRVFVWPVIQSSRQLGLDLNQLVTTVSCFTKQGIPVTIRGVVAFKVGSDNTSISNAVQRFLHDPSTMPKRVDEIFAGHIRGIVGGLTVEELIQDRDALTQEALQATSLGMEKMGLVIDTLQIAEVDDPTGYIENLSKPDIARVKMLSRKAEAEADREASQVEQVNTALVAEARRDSEIKQAELKAEVDKAEAEAAQAGPLAAAEAQQAIVERQTEVARLTATRREAELVAEVQKPAEAERGQRQIEAEGTKRATILTAEAQAEATEKTGRAEAEAAKAKGLADAEVKRALGEAEGAALEARANGLSKESDAVIGQQMADRLPEIVAAAAKAFDNVGTMTVLDGADGLMSALTSIVSTGRTVLEATRAPNSNGHRPVERNLPEGE